MDRLAGDFVEEVVLWGLLVCDGDGWVERVEMPAASQSIGGWCNVRFFCL